MKTSFLSIVSVHGEINGQSDGFIKAASASGYNSGWANNSTKIQAPGVNHLEMGTDGTMEGVYNDVFDGRQNVNSFFITPRR